ncbi:Hypothetical predicted protein [Paramuricea clavata]|uniref:Uncharacterized protein n=1 Tax=Paramuricea clavata TaxID=317549 RepID=A0A6S7G0J6_PARCT|nr:Hypothetical predicted protein [Paramuricea clavata]
MKMSSTLNYAHQRPREQEQHCLIIPLIAVQKFQSSSSEYEEDPNPVMDQFDISYDDDLFVHESETSDSQCNHDETCVEPIDMDITSELELGTIELDVAVNNHTRLIPENYYKDMEKDLDNEMKFVTEKRFICDVSKIKKLFTSCMAKECHAPIEHVNESFVGCALKIQWQCIDGHCGDWHSSGI